jgi:hypothetical protein
MTIDNTDAVRVLRETTQSSGEQETPDLAEGVLGAESQDAAAAVPGGDEPQHDDEQEKSASVAYALKLPDDLPASGLPDNYQETLASFGAAAATAGIDARVAQRLLNVYIDGTQDVRVDGPLDQDVAERTMRRHWQGDYDRNMALVRRAVENLGIGAWLDETGYGNEPGALLALARFGAGELSISKAEAEKRLHKIMTTKDHPYWRPGSQRDRKTITAEVRLLNAIVHEDDAPETVKARPARPDSPLTRIRESTAATARAQAQAMLADRAHALNNRHDPGHGAAVKKWHELIARVGK